MQQRNAEQAPTSDESGNRVVIGLLPPGLELAAADVLVASHGDYPSFRRVFPDRARRRRALRPFFAATVRDAMRFGVVRAAMAGSEVIAVAVWLPPGAFPWSAWRKIRAVPYLLRVFFADPRHFRMFMRYGSNAERAHRSGRHRYLVVAGVRPGWQRQGLGSQLMRHELERADDERTPVYLETADRANVAYYERFGFTVIDGALELVPGGPTHVAMRRPVGGEERVPLTSRFFRPALPFQAWVRAGS
jgi:ribosomal protein S18 acetylase RimI-like enzyme